MLKNSILNSYILKKLIPTFFINLILLTLILLLDKIFEMAELIISKGVPFFMVMKLLFFLLPSLLALTVPMAIVISYLMVFSEMSANKEIIACYNSGIHPLKLFKLPFFFALFLSFFMIYFNSYILPNSNYKAKKIYSEIQTKKPSAQIIENRFIDNIDGYRIYIEKMDYHRGELKNIIIYDYKDNQNIKTITAEKGKLNIYDNKKILSFNLYNGSVYKYDQKDKTKLLKFNFNNQQINIQYDSPNTPSVSKGDREYTSKEIKKNLAKFKNNLEMVLKKEKTLQKKINNKKVNDKSRKYLQRNYDRIKRNIKHLSNKINELLVEYHKKFALAFSILIFAFVAYPLGIITRKSKKGYSYIISIFLFFIYWICLIGGETLADRGLLTAFASMWLANFIMTIIAIYLNIIVIKGHFYFSFSFLNKIISGIKKHVLNKKN